MWEDSVSLVHFRPHSVFQPDATSMNISIHCLGGCSNVSKDILRLWEVLPKRVRLVSSEPGSTKCLASFFRDTGDPAVPRFHQPATCEPDNHRDILVQCYCNDFADQRDCPRLYADDGHEHFLVRLPGFQRRIGRLQSSRDDVAEVTNVRLQ